MTPDEMIDEELANARDDQELTSLRAENTRLREQVSSDHLSKRVTELVNACSHHEQEARSARRDADNARAQLAAAIREQDRLRNVIRIGGAMYRAERQVLGVLTTEVELHAPARAQLKPKQINRQGLSLDEWAAAAGIERWSISEEQHVAWIQGEDPTEHKR